MIGLKALASDVDHNKFIVPTLRDDFVFLCISCERNGYFVIPILAKIHPDIVTMARSNACNKHGTNMDLTNPAVAYIAAHL